MKQIFSFIFTVIVIVVIFKACTGNSSSSEKKTLSDFDITWYAQQMVKQQLKSPSTADFPSTANIDSIGDSTYIIKSYVDSENSFGAKLRSYWVAKVKYNGGDVDEPTSYALLDLNFINQ